MDDDRWADFDRACVDADLIRHERREESMSSDLEAEVEHWRRRFDCLGTWTIHVDKSGCAFAQVDIDRLHREATIYSWGGHGERPKHYVLHEILHVVLVALDSSDFDHEVQEQVVRDLCEVFRRDENKDTNDA